MLDLATSRGAHQSHCCAGRARGRCVGVRAAFSPPSGKHPANKGTLQDSVQRMSLLQQAVAATRHAVAIEPPPSPPSSTSGSEDSGRLGALLKRLQDKLLLNAASLRVVRGQTTCLRCHGEGRLPCPACQGAGIRSGPAPRMNTMRHAANKLKVLAGLEGPLSSDDDWIRTNRCKRCHGTGVCTCPQCEGRGQLGT